MLYQINDLRVVVEMAKRLLIKEQMDKKAGQSIASPFMKVSQNKDKMDKKVSFITVEAMEKTTDSIERLASLTDRMDTKLDRREDQYRPRVYQVGIEDEVTETITITPEIGCIAGISIKTTTEEEETIVTEAIIEIIGPITETAVGPETEMVTEMIIGMTIDQITEGMIAIKDMAIGTKITVDLGTEMAEIEAVPRRVPNPGAVPKTDTRIEGKVDRKVYYFYHITTLNIGCLDIFKEELFYINW